MTLLEEIAQRRTNETLYTAVNATIEKLATDAARELLRDPVFRMTLKAAATARMTLKAAATASVKRGVRDLLRGGGRRPKRRGRTKKG